MNKLKCVKLAEIRQMSSHDDPTAGSLELVFRETDDHIERACLLGLMCTYSLKEKAYLGSQ